MCILATFPSDLRLSLKIELVGQRLTNEGAYIRSESRS